MVSESVLCPVNMMIGALKPFLRNMRTASRPSRSGRPTSMITRSTWPDLAACTPLLPLSTATDSNSSPAGARLHEDGGRTRADRGDDRTPTAGAGDEIKTLDGERSLIIAPLA